MKIELTENRVFLTNNKFLLWIERNRKKLIYIIPIIAAFLAGFMITSGIRLDSTDYIASATHGSRVTRWQHFSTFNMSRPDISVQLDSHSDEIYLADNKAQISYNVSVYPENIKNRIECKWISSNDVVAVVNENGEVEASVPGEAEIRVSVEYDGIEYSDSAFLRVTQPVQDIYMPTTTITLYKGGAGQMVSAAVSPENASDNRISWSSNNEKIAKVDSSGYVTPVSTGLTKVVATSEDGGYSRECFVNVINYAVMVQNVDIQTEYKADARLKEGEMLKVSAAISPANARDKTLKWASDDPKVASVSQTGIIRALTEGETYISAASINGVADKFKLTVEPGDRIDRLNLYGDDDDTGSNVILPADGTVNFVNYPRTLEEMVNIQMAGDPPPKVNGGRSIASRDEVTKHMDPSYYKDGAYRYQFLDLSHPNNVSADELNRYLAGKGVLEGHAQDFINAAQRYNLSELYLVAHSILETGNGSSALARGIEVNGTTVYNMFGIGAYDNSAVYSGSQRAYKEGWTSVSAAIMGGAEFICEKYVNAPAGRQNTLYKMLFNPENPGEHEYATDCEWAIGQAVILDKLFAIFPNAVKTYEIPLYQGMAQFVFDVN